MNTFINTITSLDGFFVTFNLSFGLTQQKIFFKSLFGGIASIIALIFILVYSINQLIIWGSGDMISKLSSQQTMVSEGSHLEKLIQGRNPTQLIEIYFETEENPFDNDNMIVIPLLYVLSEESLNSIINEDNTNILQMEFDNLLYNKYAIILIKCIGNEDYLGESQKCASIEDSDDFFNNPGLLSFINVYSEEFDVSTKTYSDYYQNFKLPIDKILRSELEIYTNYEILEANEGYLFQTKEEYIQNKGCSTQIYTYTKDYLDELYDFQDIVGTYTLEMNNTVFYVRNQYPTISEVLANIGSIIQTILLIRYLFYTLNRKQLISFMKNNMLENFYPEWGTFKQLKLNKASSTVLDDKEINETSITSFHKEINGMLDYKLNHINLIYELHQMQKVLKLICPPDILLNIHSNDSKLNILADPDSKQFSIQNKWSHFKDYECAVNSNSFDPFLFSYHWKLKKKNNGDDQLASLENDQVQKQCKPTLIQENILQCNIELQIQNNKFGEEEENDQIIQV